jgi:hypothetical protein
MYLGRRHCPPRTYRIGRIVGGLSRATRPLWQDFSKNQGENRGSWFVARGKKFLLDPYTHTGYNGLVYPRRVYVKRRIKWRTKINAVVKRNARANAAVKKAGRVFAVKTARAVAAVANKVALRAAFINNGYRPSPV